MIIPKEYRALEGYAIGWSAENVSILDDGVCCAYVINYEFLRLRTAI